MLRAGPAIEVLDAPGLAVVVDEDARGDGVAPDLELAGLLRETRRGVRTVYCGSRMTAAIRSSWEACAISRAMSYAEDTFSDNSPEGSA